MVLRDLLPISRNSRDLLLILLSCCQMASTGRSMLLSLLLFAVTLSLLEMYRAKFASSELMTIAGGFVCSLLFLLLLTVRSPLLVPVLFTFVSRSK